MASNEEDISSMLTGGIITIYVGPKRKEYQVHRGLLASHEYWSEYLDSKSIKDSQIAYLREQYPHTWDLFVNWLYRGSLKNICVENVDVAHDQATKYVYLYTRAEEWDIPALQNTIMDKLHAWTTTTWDWLPPNLRSHIYKNTPQGSPLRSYVVDIFLSTSSLLEADCENGGRTAWLKLRLNYANQEFVLECFQALMQLTPKAKFRAPDRKSVCTYHKHEDGEKCSK